WTVADRLTHGLPLFHVHGLVLGVLGPLRLGGQLEHHGRFSPGALAGALERGATMAFGVPTMYHRVGDEAEKDAAVARALARAPAGDSATVGRRSTDLIRSGGYRIGAGEIEGALLEHPGVAEVAVPGEPDPDLGERIVAWVVPREGASPSAEELVAHASGLLSAHKRPREVRFLEQLPRNPMGKVTKQALRAPAD